MILLMAEILHQLRLVVFLIIYRDSYIPGGCLRFLPSTVLSWLKRQVTPQLQHSLPGPFQGSKGSFATDLREEWMKQQFIPLFCWNAMIEHAVFFFNYFPTPPCSLLLKSQKSKTNQLGCIKSQKHVKNDTLSAIVWKKTNGCIKKISTATIEDISIFSVKPWILGGTRLSNLNLKLKIVVIFRSSA